MRPRGFWEVKGQFTHTMPFPCRSPAVLKADSDIPCRSPATTLPFSDSAVSFVKVPYLVHEVLLLSPSGNYLLLNCYHNLCAVNYTSTLSLHQNNKLLLVHHKHCFISHWPLASEIGMLLIKNFLEAGISRTLAGCQNVVG
jgi:hypothetical protein